MARVSFTSEAEEIIGRLGGNVFQNSYFGIQLRGLNKPRNPQTQLQQLRRGDFRFISSSWRYLTSTEKTSWISEAGTTPEALRLFIGNNINLLIAGEVITNTYTPAAAPTEMPLEITELTTTSFLVQASSVITTVPPGQTLILFATDLKNLTHTFVNPKDFQPIGFFITGTDLSTPVDVLTMWQLHYGQTTANRFLCIKTAIVDTSNGNRADSAPTCSNNIPVTGNFIIDNAGNFLVDDAGNFIIYE